MKKMTTLCWKVASLQKKERREEGREERGREGEGEKLTTQWDVTIIVKFSGVHCIAPRTIDIAVWVSAVLKRDRHWRGGSPGVEGIQMQRPKPSYRMEGSVPLLSSLLAFG